MATLSAMFRLYDGYSSTISKINQKTNEAANKILRASGATDHFNQRLKNTGASASNASSGLKKYISAALLMAGVLKGIETTDTYVNTQARLKLINDGLQTQAELQNKIFTAANNSRGAYSDMANSIAKLGMLAGDAFHSNDETIKFAELMQKSFKLSGASTQEQSAGMYQLTQAMAAGKLQGDEFRSIMENAPMLAQAIATYTGKSKGELKKMSSEGTITADIIKNALFTAADDINKKFATLPMTFGDYWKFIKNSAIQAFSKVMESINKLINTEGFKQSVDNLITAMYVLGNVVSWIINTTADYWGAIAPILETIGGVLLVTIGMQLKQIAIKAWAAIVPWMMANWYIILIVAAIVLVINAMNILGISFRDVISFIGGAIGVFVTYFYNNFVYIWNVVAAFINFFGNVFTHPIASVKALFYDLASTVIGYIANMGKGIEDIINKIPGVKVSITSGLDGLKNKLEKASANIKTEAGLVEYVKSKDFMDYSEGYTKGSKIAESGYDKIAGALGGLTNKLTGKNISDLGTTGNPMTVEGTGNGGKVDVDMSDEDLQYLRDVAERDYINKFSTATLAPNIQVTFGDVHETADADKLLKRIAKIMQEQLATVGEGNYYE